MYTPYIRINNNPYTQLDSSAKNSLGALYSPPVNQGQIATAPGYGAQPVYKYVYYNSTINPAPVTAAAPVYWTDNTFTTVTGAPEESYAPPGVSANGASAAGYLLANTIAYSGLTAAILNQSYLWIQVGGWLGGAFEPSTVTSSTFANPIYGLGSGNWTSAVNTTIANSSRAFGVIWSPIANGVCDVLVAGYPGIFWGS